MLRAYFCLYTKELFLVVFGGPNGILESEPGLAMCALCYHSGPDNGILGQGLQLRGKGDSTEVRHLLHSWITGLNCQHYIWSPPGIARSDPCIQILE